jgi:enamine deaminase RidA (YjgF/YER057c/UK114 family)
VPPLKPASGRAEAVRKLVSEWQGRELIELGAEGRPGLDVVAQARDIFHRFDDELRGLGLSLDHTVRSRLWGRDRTSRDEGSRERVAALTGQARSASSSYISPSHFESDASVALDLWALRPSPSAGSKTLVEYDPPIVPLRYLVWDELAILSGVTAVLPTLADQIADILPRIQASLTLAGANWEQVVKMSCFLQRSQSVDDLKSLLARSIDVRLPFVEYGFVDGYSSEGKLIEIEVTAKLGTA